jgi:anti-anti-sigma factor
MLNSTGQSTIVRAPKRLDQTTSPYMAQDLETKIQPGSSIVLDLSQTQFLAPESAEVILHSLILAKQREAKLSLRGVNQRVEVVLSLAGVLQFFRKAAV